jgi:5-formyltetrahydrofolate cyclo-ligase
MKKAELRKLYKQKRNALSQKELIKYTDLLLINFQKINLPFINCVHTYIAAPAKNEIDTGHIIRFLKFRNPGLLVCIPRIDAATNEIENITYTDDTIMQLNSFGTEEPLNGETVDPEYIDVVLTPLLAFDKRGYRIGFGKGYYDKFLVKCRSDVIKIGFSFFEPIENIEDVNEFDIRLDYCVTPEKVYRF